jgi:uncharacterized membrane-anchored protein YitT (DUF2179 family)
MENRMYFWKLDSLKKQLVEQGLTQYQMYCYILVYVSLTAIVVELMKYLPPESHNVWTYAESVLNIVIPILGTILIFRANGGASGVQFAARYFSIGFVVTIRFLVLLVPVTIAMVIYWFFTYEGVETPTSFIEVAVFSAWYALLYADIARHVRAVARA